MAEEGVKKAMTARVKVLVSCMFVVDVEDAGLRLAEEALSQADCGWRQGQ